MADASRRTWWSSGSGRAARRWPPQPRRPGWRGGGRQAPGRRRVPLLRLHPDQDDGPRGRRRWPRPAGSRELAGDGDGHARLGAGAPSGSPSEATDHWDDRVAVERLEDAGATVRARHRAAGRPAQVGGRRRPTARTTGYDGRDAASCSTPAPGPPTPPVEGLADTPYWTNRDAVQVTDLPGSLVVSAAARSAASWRRSSRGSACRSRCSQHGDRLLAGRRARGGALLAEVFAARGDPRAHRRRASPGSAYADGAFTLALDTGEELTADKLLVAAGRTPNLDDLGLDTVGLDPAARTIEVDERMRAGDGLWAIGDVTGQGRVHARVDVPGRDRAARHPRPGRCRPPTYHAVPHVTFTDPEVGGVGITEAAGARRRAAGAHRAAPARGSRPAGSPTARAAAGWSRWSRTPTAACSSARPWSARRRRDPRLPRGRGARGGAGRDAQVDDLRLPDLPPCDRERPRGPRGATRE